jgi:competence protein ComEC
VLYIVKFSASVPLAVLKTVTPPVLLAAAYYICAWFLLWYKPLKNIKLKPRHAAAPICFVAVMLLGGFLQPKNLEVSFLDVGEGDSAFIRTCTNQNVLIDGGGSANPQYSSRVGETVVIPFLLDSGVSHLDAVIASHPHSDHTQGIENVIREMKVKRLIVPSISGDSGFESLLHLAGERGISILRCGSGDRIQLDERTSFLVLSPDPGGKVDQDSLNNTSLVLKLSYGQTDILFTGDAEQEIEDKLVSENGKGQLTADIIKIAHHGSTTSTGRSFLDAVKPKAAIVSVGRNNFGHPSPVTLKLLEQCGIRYYRTDECGAIRLKSDGHTVKIKRTVAK